MTERSILDWLELISLGIVIIERVRGSLLEAYHMISLKVMLYVCFHSKWSVVYSFVFLHIIALLLLFSVGPVEYVYWF